MNFPLGLQESNAAKLLQNVHVLMTTNEFQIRLLKHNDSFRDAPELTSCLVQFAVLEYFLDPVYLTSLILHYEAKRLIDCSSLPDMCLAHTWD